MNTDSTVGDTPVRAESDATRHERFYRRFGGLEIGLHVTVIVSFLSLALTGLILKYSGTDWASSISHFLGGIHAANVLHRFFALITFGYFAVHLVKLADLWRDERRLRRRVLRLSRVFSPDSLVPRWTDVRQFGQQFAWFLGVRKAPPEFDRWSYFEKFDYWAVFWGIAIIGLSGLILWFKGMFANVFPGWVLNVAFIVHSHEALLATGFIFAIHLFNTHMRPGSFPMDTVIFTGVMSESEFQEKHPAEYRRLQQTGRLKRRQARRPSAWELHLARAFGLISFLIAIFLLALIFLTAVGILNQTRAL